MVEELMPLVLMSFSLTHFVSLLLGMVVVTIETVVVVVDIVVVVIVVLVVGATIAGSFAAHPDINIVATIAKAVNNRAPILLST